MPSEDALYKCNLLIWHETSSPDSSSGDGDDSLGETNYFWIIFEAELWLIELLGKLFFEDGLISRMWVGHMILTLVHIAVKLINLLGL